MELVTAKLQFFYGICSSRKYPYSPHGGQRKFSGEGGPKEANSEGNGSGLSKSFSSVSKQELLFSLMIFVLKYSCHRLKNKLPPIYLLLIMVLQL